MLLIANVPMALYRPTLMEQGRHMVFQQMCLGVQVFLIVFLSVCLSAGQLLGLSDSLSICWSVARSLR